ncbi:MAG TPA: glycoside hydrolase [Armatimonadota bacterium]
MFSRVCACMLISLSLAGCSWAATSVSQSNGLYTIENENLRVLVSPASGLITVRDKAANCDWQQPAGVTSSTGPKFRRVLRTVEGLKFEADFGTTKGQPNTAVVSLSVPSRSADLVIEADMGDRQTEIESMPFLEPLVLDKSTGVLAAADYSNGHIYPLFMKPFPLGTMAGGSMDMPWVGVCDIVPETSIRKSNGYVLILDTSDDAEVSFPAHKVGDRDYVAPRVTWLPSKGQFAYPRKLIYRFTSKGGYVALAKAFRSYAKEKGLLVTLAEKMKSNPNIERLFGAPDIWGDSSLAFAKQAKVAGVDKMLIHGNPIPEDLKAVNQLGFLTSNYDNYTDILPLAEGNKVDSSHDLIPDNVVLQADGTRMKSWLTWDRQTQFMKRCPAKWLPAAEEVIPNVLTDHPFLGRFIDVTTSEGLYECYDGHHPLTRTEKRKCGTRLLDYFRGQKLVVGGEHGRWWAVPDLDYIEGMMSGGYASWPAGHLIRPKTPNQKFDSPSGGKLPSWDDYERYGIGYQYRVPLWELVFHDCVVSTWYWGDSSDFLLDAAPEMTPRKDAFNILYGTIPMMWANDEGAWKKDREAFLRTYRNTCKLHESLAGSEMLSHEFLTADLSVQKTSFSDGTQAVVNFGGKIHTFYFGGRYHQIPRNGFVVQGPKIEQSLEFVDQRPVTTIRSKGYVYTNITGVDVTTRFINSDRVMVNVGKSEKPVLLRPGQVGSNWDMDTMRIYILDAQGNRGESIKPAKGEVRGTFYVGPFKEPTALDLVCRAEAANF